jgi:hypothetical protein
MERFGVFTPPKTLLAFLEIPPLAFVGSVGMTHTNCEIVRKPTTNAQTLKTTPINTPKSF